MSQTVFVVMRSWTVPFRSFLAPTHPFFFHPSCKTGRLEEIPVVKLLFALPPCLIRLCLIKKFILRKDTPFGMDVFENGYKDQYIKVLTPSENQKGMEEELYKPFQLISLFNSVP